MGEGISDLCGVPHLDAEDGEMPGENLFDSSA